MSIFDEILSQHIKDEADRAVFAKYPDLQSKMSEIAQRDHDNQIWFKNKFDFEKNRTFREAELETALAQANERMAAAAAGGVDMGFDEILAGLQAKGFVDKGALETTVTGVKAEFKNENNQRDMSVLKFWQDTANLPLEHKEEFGERIDSEGFIKQYLANPNAGARQVYDQFVAQKREAKRNAEMEKLKANHAAEVEAAAKKAAEEARRAALMEVAQGNGGMPVDQGRGTASANTGWMQKRVLEQRMKQDDQGNQVVPGGSLGDGTATAAIMAQIAKDRAEGKLSVQ